MTTSSDGRWNGSDHGHQNGLLHPTGSDANSPGSPWFSSLDDEDNILEYFLNGGEHGGTLPPTPEGEPLSNVSNGSANANVNAAIGTGFFLPHHSHSAGTSTRTSTNYDTTSQQVQQQETRQKSQTRFTIDGHPSYNATMNTTSAETLIHNPNTTKKKIRPPSTPAVQHFFARPPSSSTSQQKTKQHQPQHTANHVNMGEMHHFHHPAPSQQPQQKAQHPLKQSKPMSILYPAAQIANSNGLSKNPPSSTSSSSSSLSSVAAVVYQAISGSSPILHTHQQFQGQQRPQQTASAPDNFTNNISPAVMMCTSEVMMLPPAHVYGATQSNNSTTATIQHQQSQSQWQPIHQSQPSATTTTTTRSAVSENDDQVQNQYVAHTSWLHHVNNIAMNNIGAGGPSNIANTMSASVKPTNATTNINNGMPLQQAGATFYTSTAQTPSCTDTTQQQQHQHHHQPQQIFMNTMPHPPSGVSNADILSTASLHHHFNGNISMTTNVVESEDKRARRLARNRESARQSRRRKKELLINLESQVNKLNSVIENERRSQLMTMEKELQYAKSTLLKNAILKFRNGQRQGQEQGEILMARENVEVEQMINSAVRSGGPNITMRRAAAGFQYNALSQLMLPFHQHFFLSMSLKPESFFTGAKEKRSKVNKGTGRISSKLVGEEIHKSNSNSKEKSSQSCDVNDRDKVWPLLCYELTVSLDQEERLLQSFRRIREDVKMPQHRSQVSTAGTMVSSLRNGVLYQSHSAAHRNEIGLLQILTPMQAIAFFDWFSKNKERCEKLFALHKNQTKDNGTNGTPESKVGALAVEGAGRLKTSDSLSDICKQLTEAMIAQTEL